MVGPGELGEIAVLLGLYGAVCVAFGAVFGVAAGPTIARAFFSLLRRFQTTPGVTRPFVIGMRGTIRGAGLAPSQE
ncbi:hypothetical protein HNR21_000609 [Actinomadura cellulosilytica]|uniref:Uncharacterized protein n=1 Tax=Thermomonospora cellulosilytica TaxID=1411118 RepID=A0A7W3R6L3_9ACTN|nr:hypothetical protein [Thermomonospora cellulosilytica]